METPREKRRSARVRRRRGGGSKSVSGEPFAPLLGRACPDHQDAISIRRLQSSLNRLASGIFRVSVRNDAQAFPLETALGTPGTSEYLSIATMRAASFSPPPVELGGGSSDGHALARAPPAQASTTSSEIPTETNAFPVVGLDNLRWAISNVFVFWPQAHGVELHAVDGVH